MGNEDVWVLLIRSFTLLLKRLKSPDLLPGLARQGEGTEIGSTTGVIKLPRTVGHQTIGGSFEYGQAGFNCLGALLFRKNPAK